MQETWVWSLGREDSLEKDTAGHSSVLAWAVSWTEELGGLQSIGLWRYGHDWGYMLLQIGNFSISLSIFSIWEQDLSPIPNFLFFFLICGGFCHTFKWNSHGFACVPHPDPPSPHPQFDGCSNLQVPRARTHPWWRSRFRLVRGPGGFHRQRGMSGSDSVKLLCWISHSAWCTLPTRTEEACFTLIWMTCKYHAFHYRASKNFSVLCIGVSYTTLVFI